MLLNSALLAEKQASLHKPAVSGSETSYNGRFYEIGWRDEATMVNIYQAIGRPGDGLRDALNCHYVADLTIATAITVFPSHLASAKPYLLAGKDGDDLARMLFLPETGPPEIKDLRVTLNQILARLEEAAGPVNVQWYCD